MDIKLPLTGTNRDRVLKVIQKHGALSLVDVLAKLSGLGYDAVRAALRGEQEMGVLKYQKGVWDLTDAVKEFLAKSDEQPKEEYVPQIVPPRDLSLMQKSWSGKFSFTNAPRREPIREISFVTTSTVAEPALRGMAA